MTQIWVFISRDYTEVSAFIFWRTECNGISCPQGQVYFLIPGGGAGLPRSFPRSFIPVEQN